MFLVEAGWKYQANQGVCEWSSAYFLFSSSRASNTDPLWIPRRSDRGVGNMLNCILWLSRSCSWKLDCLFSVSLKVLFSELCEKTWCHESIAWQALALSRWVSSLPAFVMHYAEKLSSKGPIWTAILVLLPSPSLSKQIIHIQKRVF